MVRRRRLLLLRSTLCRTFTPSWTAVTWQTTYWRMFRAKVGRIGIAVRRSLACRIAKAKVVLTAIVLCFCVPPSLRTRFTRGGGRGGGAATPPPPPLLTHKTPTCRYSKERSTAKELYYKALHAYSTRECDDALADMARRVPTGARYLDKFPKAELFKAYSFLKDDRYSSQLAEGSFSYVQTCSFDGRVEYCLTSNFTVLPAWTKSLVRDTSIRSRGFVCSSTRWRGSTLAVRQTHWGMSYRYRPWTLAGTRACERQCCTDTNRPLLWLTPSLRTRHTMGGGGGAGPPPPSPPCLPHSLPTHPCSAVIAD